MSTTRAINPSFMTALKEGILKPILDAVRNDDTLMLALRGPAEAHLYYRGGRLFVIKEKGNRFEGGFDKNYFRGNGVPKIDPLPAPGRTAKDWVEAIPEIKRAIDTHKIGKPSTEREFQQLVVWENNRSTIAKDTDYLITDIEFAKGNARFDMIGMRRSAGSRTWTPVIIELKYGGNAIDDKITQTKNGKPPKASGVISHLDDIERYLKAPNNDIRREIADVFGQLNALGLLPCGPKELRFSEEPPEVVFMIANYNPRSLVLDGALSKMKMRTDGAMKSVVKETSDDAYDLRFYVPAFAGYGLFRPCMKTIDEFIQHVSSFEKTASKRTKNGL